jgi:hypothetical protein
VITNQFIKKEFELILDILRQTGKDYELFPIMALAKSSKPINADSYFDTRGHNTKFEMDCGGTNYMTVKAAFAFFLMFDLATIVNNLVVITEKGKAFVEVIKEKGYVLDEVELPEEKINLS